eukprot:scaffold341_cov63-Phaeocystis_antarctica.AAC.4
MPPEVLVPEPGNFFEAQEAQEKIAKFSGRGPAADAGGAVQSAGVNDKPQEMQMLVAVRMRPLWQKEDDAGDQRCVSVLQGTVVNVTDPWYDEVLNPNRQKEKRYAFDIVFDDDVGQLEVFEKTSKGLVSGVLDGYNASVFAYGATGAGKTHTMLGSLEEPGIMVNTLHEIYGAMEADFQDSKFKVTLSYVEIYNEMIKDLLSPEGVDLKLNEDPVRGMVVQGVTEFGASTADEILELLHRGNLHRTVEPTAANQVSSRSHAVLQVTIEQSERTAHVTGNVRIGKLSMVDLAGSERASKTDNKGARLKEGANINRSLLALGNCITALADKKRVGHVPYRDSKMTRLLKDSLGGNCRTVMIASISPSHRQFEETVNTLKYANRAKNLKTQVARNVMSVSAHIAEYQRIIMELRNQVSGLKHQLQDRPTAIQEESGRLALKEVTPSGNRSKQRTLDYVENLEKQHLQNAKNALLQAGAERHALLQRLTDITTQATALPASNTWGCGSLSHTGVAASHPWVAASHARDGPLGRHHRERRGGGRRGAAARREQRAARPAGDGAAAAAAEPADGAGDHADGRAAHLVGRAAAAAAAHGARPVPRAAQRAAGVRAGHAPRAHAGRHGAGRAAAYPDEVGLRRRVVAHGAPACDGLPRQDDALRDGGRARPVDRAAARPEPALATAGHRDGQLWRARPPLHQPVDHPAHVLALAAGAPVAR